MMPARRKLDWIQFGILLTSLFGMTITGIYEVGKIVQRLDDHGQTMQEMKGDLKSLDKKIDDQVKSVNDRIDKLREGR